MSKKLNDYEWQKESSGEILPTEKNIPLVRELLDSKGPGFCLAKFKQVTMHLGTGMTHSCHHPVPHKIPLAEIENNPAALFNTSILKQARKEMLEGGKPNECDYCWRVESNNGLSDRIYKSIEPWALPDHDKISQLSGDENLYPSYLEVSFSNACNLSCVYCGPEFSSKWVEKLKAHGPMKVLSGSKDEQWVQGWQDLEKLSYKNREFNPYVDAFWKWFPDAYKHLSHYRITGGEPLMSKETFRSMQWFIDNPNVELEFAVNSNFSVPDKLWDKFISLLIQMRDQKCVKKITIYTSVEGWGEKAEYARPGLDFGLFKKRYEQIVSLGNIRCVIMATYNIFSISSIQQVFEWIYDLKLKYNPCNSLKKLEKESGFNLDIYNFNDRHAKNPSQSVVVGIDVPYLRSPTCLDVQFCSSDLVENYMIPSLDYLASHMESYIWKNHLGFEQHEVEKYKRILAHRLYYNRKNDIKRDTDDDIIVNRAKFYDYVNEIDRVNSTDFLKVFPEYTNYYNECKKAKDIYLSSIEKK